MRDGRQLQTGDEVVLLFAVMLKDDFKHVKLPHGSHAKAWEVGKIEELGVMKNAKGWGAMVGISLARLANKLCPDAVKILNAVPDANESL